MKNTWYDDTLVNRFEQKEHLTNNLQCDVLIVGGGLAGLSLLRLDEMVAFASLAGHKIMMYC